MTIVEEVIKNQMQLVKKQTDELVEKIELAKWTVTPEVLETNMNWQIGHLVLANYLHGIASIFGANERIRAKLDVKKFIKFYGLKSNPADYLDEKPTNEELKDIYDFVYEQIWGELEKIAEANLKEATEIPNIGAKTKYEALTMLFKHQSWHNGQIAILKRGLNK